MDGTHKAPNLASEDLISNMPDNVITNILDRVPLQDAVSTSVLSSYWRYRWTMLSQLEFDWRFFGLLYKQGKNNHEGVISRILLRLRGTVTKFELSINDVSDAEDINNWILLLSRKGIKDLSLMNWDNTPLDLPTHLFSCLELKRLTLDNFYFNPVPSYHGFPNLLSLELCVESESNIALGEFFTRCPLLENLTVYDLYEVCKLYLVEIAKLKNLKMLSLRFSDLYFEDATGTSSSTIFELLGSLPKLQELRWDFEDCRLIDGGAEKRFSTAFPCLKALRLSRICLDNCMKLSCAFELIRSCPNLQTLEITASNSNADSPLQLDYNTTGLLQLRNVTFECLKGSENELQLIKYLLACSPFLERIVIRPHSSSTITPDKKLKFASKLLMLHRASTVAEIDF